MLEKGVLPDAITYSSLIRGLCEKRRLNDACALFENMIKLGLQPDEFTYTSLIDGHCKEGNVEKALSLHDEMIKRGVLPDVVTYSVLINGLSKSARTKEAQRLLFKLYYEDPVPANIKYDALMHCCSKAEFKSVLALLKGFCMKGLMNEADKVYQSMLDRNWKLDGSVYSVLIHGHCRGRNVMKALSFHKQMLQCGFAPNSTSTISLIRGLFEDGTTVEAGQVIKELLNCCSLVDAEASKALIDLNWKEGDVDAVVDVLHGMTMDGLLPSSV
uniref:Pentacotripeptide-repeat region of PRORP domain-containing protein n=1 Tax=Arundo donax TaxID=35708 RepID=A0A0A9DDM5_ARUDO